MNVFRNFKTYFLPYLLINICWNLFSTLPNSQPCLARVCGKHFHEALMSVEYESYERKWPLYSTFKTLFWQKKKNRIKGPKIFSNRFMRPNEKLNVKKPKFGWLMVNMFEVRLLRHVIIYFMIERTFYISFVIGSYII